MTAIAKLRARRALELQAALRDARKIRRPLAALLREWRRLHGRIAKASARLNSTLPDDDAIAVDVPTPAAVLEALASLVDAPDEALATLRESGRAIAKLETARVRKAKADVAKLGKSWALAAKALADPEALASRLEARNEVRRLDGKGPLSLSEFREALKQEVAMGTKARRRARGGR